MPAGSTPKVTVIITAYNTADYIGEALDSVFAQTFKDYEVIVINDGSPDTPALEKVLQPYRDRILYLKQENRGLAGARNTGIRQAQGDYLAFLDSDDTWEPEYLEEQERLFWHDPLLDMVYCDARLFGDSERAGETFVGVSPQESPATFEALASGRCSILPSCVVVRTRTVAEAGYFDERFFRVEDRDLWLRIAYSGGKIIYHNAVLARRRVHARALTSNGAKMEEDGVRVCKKLLSELSLDAEARTIIADRIMWGEAEIFTRRGKECLAAGDHRAGREWFEKARALTAKATLEQIRRPYAPGFLFHWARKLKLLVTITALRIAPSLTLVALRRRIRSHGVPGR